MQVSAALAVAAERAAARQSAAVVASWRQLAAEARERSAAAERFADVHQSRRLRLVLAAWRNNVAGQACNRVEVLRAFLLRAAAAQLRAVLARWLLNARELGLARRAAEHAAADAWKGRLLSMVIQGWRCRAQGLQRRRHSRKHATRSSLNPFPYHLFIFLDPNVSAWSKRSASGNIRLISTSALFACTIL